MQSKFPDNDPLTQLAFAVSENPGVFALLLGSGLSRAAGIPTGWEITLDLIRRVATAQGIDEQSDWADWFLKTARQPPSYSVLLERLAGSPEERRAILNGYIEPTEKDREEGRKIPTVAHYAIADLVRGGYIKVIVTTNFDRLIENALRERGVEPTIVASSDALKGAEPLAHASCYVLKLHGDYKDVRILNTEGELIAYPPPYDDFLDRVFDEYGLIVCGWSGEWDIALKAALMRAPNRRYTTFWMTRGDLGTAAMGLVEHRRGKVIAAASADDFFSNLLRNVQTLEQVRRPNPLGIELVVASAKRFLAKPEYRIQLDEIFSDQTDRILADLDSPEFEPQGQVTAAEFSDRVASYEAVVEGLACAAGAVGRWGSENEDHLIVEVIRSLYVHAEKVSGGLVVYLGLRSYPAVLVWTAYALGLVRAKRWKALHDLFTTILTSRNGLAARSVETLFLTTWSGGDNSAWNLLYAPTSRKTPLSDHLAELFANWSRRFIGLTPDIEKVFTLFEVLASLSYLEQHSKAQVQKELAHPNPNNFAWMPIGRGAWDRETASKLLGEIQESALRDALLSAGFAIGDPEYLDLFVKNFRSLAERFRFM